MWKKHICWTILATWDQGGKLFPCRLRGSNVSSTTYALRNLQHDYRFIHHEGDVGTRLVRDILGVGHYNYLKACPAVFTSLIARARERVKVAGQHKTCLHVHVYTLYMFLCKNTKQSTFSGSSTQRFLSTIFPASLKIRSDDTEVACAVEKCLANALNVGNRC